MGEPERIEKLVAASELAVLAAAFAVTHILAWFAGLRFDSVSLGLFMQFLDPELLRHRLLESVFYLHIQPPLFNLFLGSATTGRAGGMRKAPKRGLCG